MRVHLLSDLHLEFAKHEPTRIQADLVVVAGDVCPGVRGAKWLLEHYRDVPVIYVLGNHEYYGQKVPSLIVQIETLCRGSNIQVLENHSVEVGDTVFLGCTLWTDFSLLGDRNAAEVECRNGMTDFRRIRVAPSYRRFRPRDAMLLHAQSVKWLANVLESMRGRKTVVVTHHAPSIQSVPPELRTDLLSAAYASNLEKLVTDSGAKLWLHGHLHAAADYTLGCTRVVANPRGYPGESTGFTPDRIVEI